jgi:hypothetical protein
MLYGAEFLIFALQESSISGRRRARLIPVNETQLQKGFSGPSQEGDAIPGLILVRGT